MSRPVSHDVFRERVRQILNRSGMTFAAFAREAGLDRSTLSQLLTGPMPRLPRAETLAMIAQAAHVSVDWLLGLSQREEVGAEIIQSVMRVEPYGAVRQHDAFLDWLMAAQGMRVCSVPIGMPDLLKTDEVLRLEFPASYAARGMTPTEVVNRRLEMMRQPHQQLELAISRESFQHFALGLGIWGELSPASRRLQLERVIALTEEFYPALRIYLYDAGRSYSVPFTVFGAQRVAIFLGTNYLVLNAAPHIQIFLTRFDELVRAAVVQPHQFGQEVAAMIGEVR